MHLSEKSLDKIREFVLTVTPEITAILDEFTKINGMRLDIRETSEDDAAQKGVEIIKEYIDMLFVRQYDGIIGIFSALYEIPPEELREKPLRDIVGMIEETLGDETLMRFFPRLRLLAQRMQSAT